MASAAVPLVGAAIGGIGGALSKPKYKDQSIYALGGPERKRLAADAFGQLSGMYKQDPGTFWGGPRSWTTSMGMEPEGGLKWEDFSGGNAAAGQANVALGINDPTYALDIPKEQEERLLSRANEMGSAQAGESWRQLEDQMTRGGTDTSSPAAMALRASIERGRMRGVGETLRDVRSNWMDQARALRNQWNQLATGVSETNANLETQASLANAARRSGAAQFLVGTRGQDEARDLERYQMLNAMNMGWQSPFGQKTAQPSTFSRIMQGMEGGFGMGGDIASLFGKRKGGGGGGFGGGGWGSGVNYGSDWRLPIPYGMP